MALKLISNASATYQEASRSMQSINAKSSSTQNTNEGNTVVSGTAEMAVATKLLSEQQNSTSDGNPQKNDAQVNAQRMKSAVTQANTKMKQVRTGCEFSYDEDTNRVSITVYNKDTKEVIREIPPEESLQMLQKAWEIAGLLVDEKR